MTRTKWSAWGLSLLVIIVLAIWIATGDVRMTRTNAPVAQAQEHMALTPVEVTWLAAQPYQPVLRLQGQLEPWQSVVVSARAAGTVERLDVQLGQSVKAGTELVSLSVDGRNAVQARWQAQIRKLEADLAAIKKLQSKNLAAETDILRLQSELAAAHAEREAAELALAYLTPVAPFDGVINQRHVDVGTLVQVGTPLFQVVQIQRLKAVGQVPQQSAERVQPGQSVDVALLDGSRLAGVVSFVASVADPETRSFAVEVIVENPEQRRVAGGTAGLNIQLPEHEALFISPAYLSLDDAGRPGVKFVDDDDRVVFQPVQLLSVSTDGAWVSGLPAKIRLITRGGGFVAEGERVQPVEHLEGQG